MLRKYSLSIGKSVSPFVVALCPAPPVARERIPTALQGTPPGLPASYLLRPHSPSTVFESPGLPGQAPGTTPATAEVPALAMSFTLRVTSLSRCYSAEPSPYASLSRVGHRFRQVIPGDFWGPNVEASPYPSVLVFRGSAPSPAKLTGKPSRAFHG